MALKMALNNLAQKTHLAQNFFGQSFFALTVQPVYMNFWYVYYLDSPTFIKKVVNFWDINLRVPSSTHFGSRIYGF